MGPSSWKLYCSRVKSSSNFNLLWHVGFSIHLRGNQEGVLLTSCAVFDLSNDPAQSQRDHVMGIPEVPQPQKDHTRVTNLCNCKGTERRKPLGHKGSGCRSLCLGCAGGTRPPRTGRHENKSEGDSNVWQLRAFPNDPKRTNSEQHSFMCFAKKSSYWITDDSILILWLQASPLSLEPVSSSLKLEHQ